MNFVSILGNERKRLSSIENVGIQHRERKKINRSTELQNKIELSETFYGRRRAWVL